jgi:3-phenylpropionate/trans-cinnamate dioxygenase ferredoxin subunit
MSIVYHPLIEFVELPENGRVFIEINKKPVVVLNINGQIFAVGDECPHDGGPIGDGTVEGEEIICPRHGARFCLSNGKATRLPATENIPWYPARVTNGMIEIGVDEA